MIERTINSFYGPLGEAEGLVMDLDGVCYNMVQEFTDWVGHNVLNFDRIFPDVDHFVPTLYNFWVMWGQDDDWFREVFPTFLEQGGLQDPRYTLQGSTGLGAWAFANAHEIPVHVVTSRDFGQSKPDMPILEWMWREGLSADTVIVSKPGESKGVLVDEFVDPINPHRLVTLEDTRDNAVDYLGYGYNSYLVDRPWNVQSGGRFSADSQAVVFDSQWTMETVGRVYV